MSSESKQNVFKSIENVAIMSFLVGELEKKTRQQKEITIRIYGDRVSKIKREPRDFYMALMSELSEGEPMKFLNFLRKPKGIQIWIYFDL